MQWDVPYCGCGNRMRLLSNSYCYPLTPFDPEFDDYYDEDEDKWGLSILSINQYMRYDSSKAKLEMIVKMLTTRCLCCHESLLWYENIVDSYIDLAIERDEEYEVFYYQCIKNKKCFINPSVYSSLFNVSPEYQKFFKYNKDILSDYINFQLCTDYFRF